MTHPASSLSREWVLRLVLLTASCVVCATGLELTARVLDASRGSGKEGNEPTLYIEQDPHLGWRLRPRASAVYRRGEYTVEVKVNALGMRDPERSPRPAPGRFRVLALGDSFVEGYTVAVGDTVSQRLEVNLAAGCSAEVLNAGVAAYSTDQEYLWHQKFGAALEPRLVLAFLYYNDLFGNTADRYWGAPKPLLEPEADGLRIRNFPVPSPGPPDPASDPEPRRYLQGSAAFDWFANRLMRGAPRAFQALSHLGLWEPLGDDGLADQLLVYKNRRGQRLVEAAWQQTGRILGALAAEVSARGARFALVYVPSRMEVSDRDWELTLLRYGLNAKVWDRGLVGRRIADVARAGGYPLLDLTPALRAADGGLAGGPYFQIDGHWNALGHRAAAEAVAAFLRQRGLVPAGC